MDEIREHVNILAKESIKNSIEFLHEHQDCVVMAFIAKYKCQPEDIQIVHCQNQIYIQMKEPNYEDQRGISVPVQMNPIRD